MDLTRRRTLRFTAAGVVAVALPRATALAARRRPPTSLVVPGVLAMFDDARQVQTLGRAYRRMFAPEDDPWRLEAALLEHCHLPDTATDAEVRAWLDRRSVADFDLGHIVRLNGWILARTEARQCALLSLRNVAPAGSPACT